VSTASRVLILTHLFQLFNDKKPSKWNEAAIECMGYEADDYFGGRARAARFISGGEPNPIGKLMWQLYKNQYPHTQVQWSDIAYEFEGLTNTASEINVARNEWGIAYECLRNAAY
jgi:hypothetical protein